MSPHTQFVEREKQMLRGKSVNKPIEEEQQILTSSDDSTSVTFIISTLLSSGLQLRHGAEAASLEDRL